MSAPQDWTWAESGIEVPDLTAALRGRLCGASRPNDTYRCTRNAGHTGRHAAGTGHRITAVWGQS